MTHPALRRLAPLLAMAALAVLLRPPTVAAQDDATPTFLETIDVRLVELEVFVTDKQGRPVTGLTARDFEVEEDGKRMKLTHFRELPAVPGTAGAGPSPEGVPAAGADESFVMILVDNHSFDAGNRKRLLEELDRLLGGDALGAAQLAVVAYEGYPRVVQGFTRDRGAVRRAVAELLELSPLGIARYEENDAYLRTTLEGLASTLDLLQSAAFSPEDVARRLRNFSREVDLYGDYLARDTRATSYSLSHVVNAMAALPGRKAIVLVSEGRPARPGDEFHRAIDQAFRQAADPDSGGPLTGDAAIDLRSATFDTMADQAQRGRPDRNNKQGELRADGMAELAALANGSRVSFYTLKPRQPGGAAPELSGRMAEFYTPQVWNARERNYAETLEALAADTGGQSIFSADLGLLLDRVEADFGGYYSIGFEPPEPGDGGFHQLKVKVKRRGTRVRTRSGYIDKPLAAYVADRTSAALLLAMDDNPMGVSIDIGIAQSIGKNRFTVPVRVLLPLDAITLSEQAGVHRGSARIFVAAMAADGDAAPVQTLDLGFEIPADQLAAARAEEQIARLTLEMRGGRQRIAVGLVDTVTGAASFVSRAIEIG